MHSPLSHAIIAAAAHMPAARAEELARNFAAGLPEVRATTKLAGQRVALARMAQTQIIHRARHFGLRLRAGSTPLAVAWEMSEAWLAAEAMRARRAS